MANGAALRRLSLVVRRFKSCPPHLLSKQTQNPRETGGSSTLLEIKVKWGFRPIVRVNLWQKIRTKIESFCYGRARPLSTTAKSTVDSRAGLEYSDRSKEEKNQVGSQKRRFSIRKCASTESQSHR